MGSVCLEGKCHSESQQCPGACSCASRILLCKWAGGGLKPSFSSWGITPWWILSSHWQVTGAECHPVRYSSTADNSTFQKIKACLLLKCWLFQVQTEINDLWTRKSHLPGRMLEHLFSMHEALGSIPNTGGNTPRLRKRYQAQSPNSGIQMYILQLSVTLSFHIFQSLR